MPFVDVGSQAAAGATLLIIEDEDHEPNLAPRAGTVTKT
jgi:hypothetical protein